MEQTNAPCEVLKHVSTVSDPPEGRLSDRRISSSSCATLESYRREPQEPSRLLVVGARALSPRNDPRTERVDQSMLSVSVAAHTGARPGVRVGVGGRHVADADGVGCTAYR